MKKFLSLTTALVLALSVLCVGALADPNPADIVGTWKLTAFELLGESYDPADMGLDMVFTFNEDYTVLVQADGEDETGTWAIENGLVTMIQDSEDEDEEGEEMGLTYEDGVLFIEMEEEGISMKMVFSKVEE
ncbi:MAG: lipocalin family protein [Clostridia bacterium]|nr:lipocalin family protein [Clostridia bacterium]